jgi:hypothetical protein
VHKSFPRTQAFGRPDFGKGGSREGGIAVWAINYFVGAYGSLVVSSPTVSSSSATIRTTALILIVYLFYQ